jgi:integrase
MINSNHLNKRLAVLKRERTMMRLKNGKWFAAFKFKGRMVGTSLYAYEHERSKAARNLGRLLEKIERGEEPNQLRKKFKTMIPRYWEQFEKRPPEHRTDSIQARNESIIRIHMVPWFGDHKMEDINENHVLKYILHRETPITIDDRTTPGAAMSTLKKELRILKDFMVIAYPKWELPELQFQNKGKSQVRALTMAEITHVQPFVRLQSKALGGQYELIFQIMAYSSMDISEVVGLNVQQIDQVKGFITTVRGKTGIGVRIAIGRLLSAPLREALKVCDIQGNLFPGINARQVSKALERAFKAAGLKEFSAKSLRHFLPSLLGNEGWSDTIIGKVLGHAPGSRCTKVYIHPYDSKLREAMEVLDQAGEFERRE